MGSDKKKTIGSSQKLANETISKTVSIYVSSLGISTVTKPLTDSAGNSRIGRFITGAINGVPFEVECDRSVEVSEDVAAVLQNLINSQKGA